MVGRSDECCWVLQVGVRSLEPVYAGRQCVTEPNVRTAALEGLTARQAARRGAAPFRAVLGSDVDAPYFRVQSIGASPREALLSSGDVRGRAVSVVASSQVRLARPSGGCEHLVDLVGPAGQYGQGSVLDPRPRSATGSAPEVVDDAARLRGQIGVTSLPSLERVAWNLVKAASGFEHLAHGMRVALLKPAIQFRAVARRRARPRSAGPRWRY